MCVGRGSGLFSRGGGENLFFLFLKESNSALSQVAARVVCLRLESSFVLFLPPRGAPPCQTPSHTQQPEEEDDGHEEEEGVLPVVAVAVVEVPVALLISCVLIYKLKNNKGNLKQRFFEERFW